MDETLTQEQINTIKTQNDARVATIAKGGSVEPTDTTGTDSSALMNQLVKKMFADSDIVSSSDTGYEAAFKEHSANLQAQKEAEASRISQTYGEKISGIKEAGATSMTSAREAQRGFGVNRAALQQIQSDTDKQVKQYEQMEQDALLQNNTQLASQISGLKVQAIQFQQETRQQEFSNLLNMGGFVTQMQQAELQTRKFAQDSTQQDLQNQFSREQFEFSKFTSLEEQRQSQIRLNIMNEELKIKQAQSGGSLIPDPGFVDVPTGNKVGAAANNLLSLVQQQKDAGLITTPEEEEAATIKAYQQIRGELSQSEATNEAIAKKLGMDFDDTTGELGFIEGQITEKDVPLPGESAGFTNPFELLSNALQSGSKLFENKTDKLLAERKESLKKKDFNRVREIDRELNK